MTTSWHGALFTTRGGTGLAMALRPPRLDLLRRRAHAGAVNRAVAGIGADDDGKSILPAAAIDDVGEKKRLALVLFDAADILPAHQRMQLGVLVDRRGLW